MVHFSCKNQCHCWVKLFIAFASLYDFTTKRNDVLSVATKIDQILKLLNFND